MKNIKQMIGFNASGIDVEVFKYDGGEMYLKIGGKDVLTLNDAIVDNFIHILGASKLMREPK